MSNIKIKPEDFHSLIRDSIHSTFKANGVIKESKEQIKSKAEPVKILTNVKEKAAELKEALIAIPRTFILKTERLSKGAKEAHFNLYKKYVDSFNKASSELDAVNKQTANSNQSPFRSFKVDENYNLNGMKLHELYWSNISDLQSEISVDSLPYMRLARDWGTFENWQIDFMATAMSARNGWAICFYEPYKNTYMNVIVDSHDKGVPVGAIPVIVMDMWEHAYFKDYLDDKKSYLVGMMKELNWGVIEARMKVAEQSNLNLIYQIAPIVNDGPERLLAAAEKAEQVPIASVQPVQGTVAPAIPSTPGSPAAVPEQPGTSRMI